MRGILIAFLTLSLAGCNASVQYEVGTTEISNLQQGDR
jgi:hypothetical protein